MKSTADKTKWKQRLYDIIFEADTPAGRTFDIVLLAAIVASVLVVMLESVAEFKVKIGGWLVGLEWFFTILFTLEYLARLWVVNHKRKYVLSFFGLIDLISILPTYLGLFFIGAQSLLVIRSIRLLRIFRVLKLVKLLGASNTLVLAIRASQYKIAVFMIAVVTTVIIAGTMMFLIEGEANGFTSIPKSIYWAIVTMTTVGYGDIAPQTTLGQTVASFIMILGYGIIAVPTGIVSSEMMSLKSKEKLSTQVCPHCLKEGHDSDAVHCKYCGDKL
jgi:voltage-gated potassium channel